MTKDEMQGLKPGDLVRHKMSGRAMIVQHHGGEAGVIVAQVQVMTNPCEWNRVTHDGAVKAEGDA